MSGGAGANARRRDGGEDAADDAARSPPGGRRPPGESLGGGQGGLLAAARGKPTSQALHVVAGEGAEVAGALGRADVPAVVALLHHVHGVALVQLQLVLVLRPVVVQRSVPSLTDVRVSVGKVFSIFTDTRIRF